MESELRTKIERSLNNINSEKDALYLFVKIRKFIELNRERTIYPILLFYCDWIVHHEMSFEHSVSKIESLLLEAEENTDKQLEFIALEPLRIVLSEFLLAHGFSNISIQSWDSMRGHIAENLIDCPIIVVNSDNPIAGFSLERAGSVSESKYSINWLFTYKDSGAKSHGTFHDLSGESPK